MKSRFLCIDECVACISRPYCGLSRNLLLFIKFQPCFTNISIIVKQTFSDFLRVSSTRIVPSHFYAIFYFVLCIQHRVIHLNMWQFGPGAVSWLWTALQLLWQIYVTFASYVSHIPWLVIIPVRNLQLQTRRQCRINRHSDSKKNCAGVKNKHRKWVNRMASVRTANDPCHVTGNSLATPVQHVRNRLPVNAQEVQLV